MHNALVALAATPAPTPSSPPDDLVTPGPWGFAVIAVLGIVVILLILDMLRRIRRGRYREEIRAELDAQEQADAAVRASDVDDQDIDEDEDGTGDDPARR